MAVRQLFRISVLVLLAQMLYRAVTQQCTNGGSEVSILGWMLQGHIYKTMLAELPLACATVCRQDDRCQSINWVISLHMCEFNNRTKEARPEDFVPNPDGFYFRRDRNRVPLGSIPELPADTCNEIKMSEGQAVSGKYWLSTIKSGMSVLSHCNMETDECHNYQTLTSGDRKVTHGSSPILCDNSLGPGWFRFQGDAGTKMPTSCVPVYRCGTVATGWLNGSHPTIEDGKVTRQVCFNWYSNRCTWSINIQVLNCSGYFLYFINGTPPEHPCHLRYCGTD